MGSALQYCLLIPSCIKKDIFLNGQKYATDTFSESSDEDKREKTEKIEEIKT
jgi:hypothetical protein